MGDGVVALEGHAANGAVTGFVRLGAGAHGAIVFRPGGMAGVAHVAAIGVLFGAGMAATAFFGVWVRVHDLRGC